MHKPACCTEVVFVCVNICLQLYSRFWSLIRQRVRTGDEHCSRVQCVFGWMMRIDWASRWSHSAWPEVVPVLQERLATMAQAIVTSQLMNLHFGRLKDQGRLTPVQARFYLCPRSFGRWVSDKV